MSLLQVPQKWDGEADVIVIGGGNAGIPAAVTAHDKGAKVMVLETSSGMASSLAMISGGTPFAGTDIQKEQGIEDSADELCEEAVKISGGSPELWRAIADRQLEVYNWLRSIGAKPEAVLVAPGHRVARSIRFEGHGPALCQLLKKVAEDKRLDMRFKHHAEGLIVDPEKGRVIGIAAKKDNKVLNFRARKAVVLTTGGFCQNLELVKEYGPNYADLIATAPPTHQGDGLKMAQAAGAATAGIGLAVCPSLPVCAETGHNLTGVTFGGISVNRDAQRYSNEAVDTMATYTIRYKELLAKDPSGLNFNIFDEGIRQANPYKTKPREKIYEADTIEELAEKLGLDPKALKATVDEYNSDLEKYGYDRKFGRRLLGMALPGALPMKLDTPPYYGVKCKICLTSMKGGLKINAKDQVIDQFGDVIPGLYAAGEITGGLMGIPSHYYTGTMTLQAFTQGRIAGDNAADEPSN
jgi:fumarate reductase flavoprotein subunit